MATTKEHKTFDSMTNLIEESEYPENTCVAAEINRCRDIYERRQDFKRRKAADIKPLYHEHMKRKELVAKYPVYQFSCVWPKIPKYYKPCHHVGQIILDRDILTADEHISFLAQPKMNFQRHYKPIRCTYKTKFLPNCTTRIDSLSHPKVIRTQHNWHDFHNVLSTRQATNLRKILQRPMIEYTTIQKALTYVFEERRLHKVLQRTTRKKCSRMRRKLLNKERKHMCKIILALFEVMQDYLTSDQFVLDSIVMSNLCRVIENSVTDFCCFENVPTSQLQHFISTVSRNLAVWIEKFTSNCGFTNSRLEKEEEDEVKPDKTAGEQNLVLPVKDFIPYHSPSLTGTPEDNAEELDIYEEPNGDEE